MAELTGIILEKFDARPINDNFTVREFVAKTDYNSEYPQEILFQLQNAKCGLLDLIPHGVPCKIHFQIKGKRYNNEGTDKWFNVLQVWKIEKI